jgi:hypothetical protein
MSSSAELVNEHARSPLETHTAVLLAAVLVYLVVDTISTSVR